LAARFPVKLAACRFFLNFYQRIEHRFRRAGNADVNITGTILSTPAKRRSCDTSRRRGARAHRDDHFGSASGRKCA